MNRDELGKLREAVLRGFVEDDERLTELACGDSLCADDAALVRRLAIYVKARVAEWLALRAMIGLP